MDRRNFLKRASLISALPFVEMPREKVKPLSVIYGEVENRLSENYLIINGIEINTTDVYFWVDRTELDITMMGDKYSFKLLGDRIPGNNNMRFSGFPVSIYTMHSLLSKIGSKVVVDSGMKSHPQIANHPFKWKGTGILKEYSTLYQKDGDGITVSGEITNLMFNGRKRG